MYPKKLRISFLLLIILITVGCTTTKGPLFQNDNPRMNIRLSDYSVIFDDKRQNTENRKLFVHVRSRNRKGQVSLPSLPELIIEK